MTLENFRAVNLKIDRANGSFLSDQFAKAGDYNGRRLVVQLSNAGVVGDLTGVDVNLGWQHDTLKNTGLDPFEPVDLSQGIFEIYYPKEMLTNGNVTALIQIIENDHITETKNFKIKVEKSVIDEDTIVSENSFTVLQDALLTVNRYDSRIANVENSKVDKSTFEQSTNNLTAQLQQTEQELSSQLQQKIDEVLYDVASNTINFYSDNSLVNSFSVTGATNDDAIHSYIDTLITDGAIQGVTVADGSIGPSKTSFLGYNALNPNVIVGSYYTAVGKKLETAAFNMTEKILLEAGEIIEVKATGYLQAVSMISVVTSDGTFIKAGAVSIDNAEHIYRYTATEETEYVVVSYNNLHPKKITRSLNLSYILENFKEKTKSIYTPKNVDTLERLNITNQSQNIFNEQSSKNTTDAFLSVIGVISSQENTGITAKIDVSFGDIIRYKHLSLYGPSSSGSIFEGFLYDKNDNPLYLIGVDKSSVTPPYQSVLPTITEGYATLTIPNNLNISYAKLNYQPNTEFMVVKNSTYPSTYSPFKYELEGLRISSENIDGATVDNTDLDFLKHLIYDVTIVGDSLMDGGYYGEGYSGAAIKESPPYFLEKLTDWTITDVSKNGASPVSWWTDFGATTDYAKSDAIIIGLGTNAGLTDTMATDVNVGTQTFANTQTGQYARIINAFRNANPKAHIFLVKVFESSGDTAITNTVIDKMASLFDCKILDESELFGNPVMHYNNAVHYGKVGNLHKAKLLLNQMTTHINDNLSDYELLIDTF